MKGNLISEIREKVEALVEREKEVELIDVKMEKGRTLAIYLWKKGGIDLDTLSRYSFMIEKILDEEVNIEGSYQLAISSPDWSKGINNDEDLGRNLGEELEFHLREPIEKNYTVIGVLKGFDDLNMIISVNSEELVIPRENIKKVKVYFSL